VPHGPFWIHRFVILQHYSGSQLPLVNRILLHWLSTGRVINNHVQRLAIDNREGENGTVRNGPAADAGSCRQQY
jgi:hypothetical protein